MVVESLVFESGFLEGVLCSCPKLGPAPSSAEHPPTPVIPGFLQLAIAVPVGTSLFPPPAPPALISSGLFQAWFEGLLFHAAPPDHHTQAFRGSDRP